MKPEINTATAETVQTGGDQAVVQERLVRLFNEYGSTTGSDHADAVAKIMYSAMDKLAVYLAENNVCPRDAMGYCVMIVTQHLSAYGLRRAMGMKRREREFRSLPNVKVHTPLPAGASDEREVKP